MITRQEERKQERNGILISSLIHGALLLLVFFVVIFKPTDPAIESMGGEGVNFGFDADGMGDVNSLDPVSFNEPQTEQVENTEASEPVSESDQDFSSVNTNETAETVVPDKTTEASPKKPTQSVTPVQSPNNKYPTSNTGDGGGNKPGNQGDPNGALNNQNRMGNPGNGTGNGIGDGNGSKLEMNGWHWESIPKVNDASEESGKIVFKVTVDEDGEIVSIKLIEKQVSDAAVVKKYEDAVRKISFVKNRDNSNVQQSSTGIITFIIRKN